MSGKTIRTVTVDDEHPHGTPIRLPLGADVVAARRCITGALQLVVIHGASATIPVTVDVHVVRDGTTAVPARGRYLCTVDDPHPVHVFVAPHRH